MAEIKVTEATDSVLWHVIYAPGKPPAIKEAARQELKRRGRYGVGEPIEAVEAAVGPDSDISAPWAIVEGGGVADRFTTRSGAQYALDRGGYPESAEVSYEPEDEPEELHKDFEQLLEHYYHAQSSVLGEYSVNIDVDMRQLIEEVERLAAKHGVKAPDTADRRAIYGIDEEE